MELGLKGKTALVTGASEGIGMAIAREAGRGGRAGRHLRPHGGQAAGRRPTRSPRRRGWRSCAIPADLRSLAGCEGFVEQAAGRLGGVDILVNNAGRLGLRAVRRSAGRGLRRRHQRQAARLHPLREGRHPAHAPARRRQHRQRHRHHPAGHRPAHAGQRLQRRGPDVQQGALDGAGPAGHPGEQRRARPHPDGARRPAAGGHRGGPGHLARRRARQLVKTIPSGRVGTLDDIADAVCFLVSERATYVNGAALVVDGSKSVVI